jgi:hypothetical protein
MTGSPSVASQQPRVLAQAKREASIQCLGKGGNWSKQAWEKGPWDKGHWANRK